MIVIVYILIYIDDIIVASSSSEATNCLLRSLKEEFALKDLGELHYFLGIEVYKVRDGILLNQNKYASDLLKRVNIFNCKPVNNLLLASKKLSSFEGIPLGPKDSVHYRSVVGALQYLTPTIPNISFSK
jgi:histone deacetylase 1/2